MEPQVDGYGTNSAKQALAQCCLASISSVNYCTSYSFNLQPPPDEITLYLACLYSEYKTKYGRSEQGYQTRTYGRSDVKRKGRDSVMAQRTLTGRNASGGDDNS
jgi:hypothetical protein